MHAEAGAPLRLHAPGGMMRAVFVAYLVVIVAGLAYVVVVAAVHH